MYIYTVMYIEDNIIITRRAELIMLFEFEDTITTNQDARYKPSYEYSLFHEYS